MSDSSTVSSDPTPISMFPKRDIEKEIRTGSDGFPEGFHLRQEFPYLKDVKCDFRLSGFPAAWYPFMSEVSPARLTMYGKHQAQAVVVDGSEQPHCYSGLETDHASYATNTSRREEDVEVLKAIPKYRIHRDNLGAKEIPSWLVIYRGIDSKQINAFEIDRYVSRAEGWGYKNNWNDANIRKYLGEGELLLKETVLSEPPTVSGPRHMTGTNANVCYLPISEADQDAVVISDRLAAKLKSFGYLRRQGIIPPNYVPLPIHATPEYPDKWFLDVGEKVPEDGVVCVLRKMNTDRFCADASEDAMRTYDPNLDIIIKANPGSIVADVNFLVNKQHLEEIPQQVRMYVEDNRQYFKEILDVYNKYPQAKIGDHFGKLVLEAICRLVGLNERVYGIDPKDAATLEGFKNSIVDYIHVEFSFFHEIPVQPGTKLAGRSGDKGLVSAIWRWQDMPRDENGIYADMIMDPPSPVKRLSMGQDYEQIINRIGVFVTRKAQELLDEGSVQKAFDTIVEWYSDVHPNYGELTKQLFKTTTDQKRHVQDIIDDALYMNIPAYLKTVHDDNVDKWIDKWGAQSTRVTYTSKDFFGDMVERTTDHPFAIGSKYIIRLCKDGEFSSPGVSTVSHHGVPTAPPKSTGISSLFKQKPARRGEDENRNLSDVDPKEVLRDMRLTSRSPRAVERVIRELYRSPMPTAIGRFDITDEELAATDVIAAQYHHLMAITGVETFDTLRSADDPTMLAPDDYIGQ